MTDTNAAYGARAREIAEHREVERDEGQPPALARKVADAGVPEERRVDREEDRGGRERRGQPAGEPTVLARKRHAPAVYRNSPEFGKMGA
ncbi:MAG: hypothetical protein M0D55_02410 [Elusimicrobiota bacterium]|nr:MAG: hypothetical protein M0D55_02410 [Elusimicrobiota bacterium]